MIFLISIIIITPTTELNSIRAEFFQFFSLWHERGQEGQRFWRLLSVSFELKDFTSD